MMLTRIALLAPWSALVAFSHVQAASVGLQADRQHFRQGEHALVTITVRQSAYRPVVTPPSVPYCRIEPVGERQSRPTLSPQRGTAHSGAAGTNQRLADALRNLESQLEKLPGDLAPQNGSGSLLLGEYQDMLRDIRRQAIQSLNNGSGPADHEVQFRVTPQRSGELTLPPFLVKVGPQAVQTKSLTLIIDPAASAGDAIASASRSASPSTEKAEALAVAGSRGFAFEPWHWALVLLAGPLVGAIAYLLVGRRRVNVPHPLMRLVPPPVALIAPSRLESAHGVDEVACYVAAAVRTRCRLPAGEVTATEARAALQTSGVAPALAERFQELLDDCTAARFAPAPFAVFSKELAHSARILVAELDCESAPRR